MATDLQNGQHPVLRLTQAAYDALESFATASPEKYLDPETDFESVLQTLGITDYAEETGITCEAPFSLKGTWKRPGTTGRPASARFLRQFSRNDARKCNGQADMGMDDPLQAAHVHAGTLAPATQHQLARVHHCPLVRRKPRKCSLE